jgi:hypothetical protein
MQLDRSASGVAKEKGKKEDLTMTLTSAGNHLENQID